MSTVDLELNHGFWENENLWYETMVFPEDALEYSERYATRAEAMEGHKRAVGWVRSERWLVEKLG